jgi:hypothetical protein
LTARLRSRRVTFCRSRFLALLELGIVCSRSSVFLFGCGESNPQPIHGWKPLFMIHQTNFVQTGTGIFVIEVQLDQPRQ